MRRFYLCLLWLHPRAFRERFADEMLCDFEHAGAASAAPFVADATVSLARQWLVRSGAWKLAAGAALSAIVLCAWMQSESHWEIVQEKRLEAQIKPRPPLNRAEFNREAAQAVAMLARYREENAKKARSSSRDKTTGR